MASSAQSIQRPLTEAATPRPAGPPYSASVPVPRARGWGPGRARRAPAAGGAGAGGAEALSPSSY
eukprot:2598526-Pyramimonas_sp.AAC.1